MPSPSQAFMQLAGGFGPWAERGGAKRREGRPVAIQRRRVQEDPFPSAFLLLFGRKG